MAMKCNPNEIITASRNSIAPVRAAEEHCPRYTTNRLIHIRKVIVPSLMRSKFSPTFRQPITDEGFRKAVQCPVDLSVVKRKLEQCEYHTGDECLDDLRQMLSDVRGHFSITSPEYNDSLGLEKLLTKKIREFPQMVEVQEDSPTRPFRNVSRSVPVATSRISPVSTTDSSCPTAAAAVKPAASCLQVHVSSSHDTTNVQQPAVISNANPQTVNAAAISGASGTSASSADVKPSAGCDGTSVAPPDGLRDTASCGLENRFKLGVSGASKRVCDGYFLHKSVGSKDVTVKVCQPSGVTVSASTVVHNGISAQKSRVMMADKTDKDSRLGATGGALQTQQTTSSAGGDLACTVSLSSAMQYNNSRKRNPISGPLTSTPLPDKGGHLNGQESVASNKDMILVSHEPGMAAAGGVKEEEPSWNCVRCTYANQPAMIMCECCELPRCNGSVADVTELVPKYPSTWSIHKSVTQCSVVTLGYNDPEFLEVQANVRESCLNTMKRIISIQRIENKLLYQQYSVARDHMNRVNAGVKVANERMLWHGTTAATADIICKRGFNRSYCGKNATMFGQGVYFATDFAYSAQPKFSVPSTIDRSQYIFQCRVLTGQFCTGHPSFVEPPVNNTLAQTLYDSVVDDMREPLIFVIFHDTYAYPEYLVKFSG